MLDYSIKVILFQILLLAIYDLFLKKETFFQWNRWYLLVTSFISYIIPFIKISSVSHVVPQEYIIALPEVMLYPTSAIEKNISEPTQVFNYLAIIYGFGILYTALFFIIKLLKLRKFIKTGAKLKINHYFLVLLQGNNAFSFFNYIFLGKTIAEENKQQIIEHELVHVQQKHSIDLLFFELQKIVCWFNPMSYIFQRRIAEVHEFIADAQSIKTIDKTTYFNKLLSETFGVQHLSFINPFFKHSLIKKRIKMLHKKRSKQLLKFKYLLLVPLLGGMLLYSSCEKEPNSLTKNELEKMTLEIPSSEQIPNLRNSKKYDAFRNFLEENPNYLIWMRVNDKGNFQFEIHNESEKPPQKFVSLHSPFVKEDGNIKMFVDISGLKALNNNNFDTESIPFAAIDKAPVFPGCENAEDTKTCLQENIQKFVARKFNTSLANQLGLEPGKKRVYVQFKIDKDGNIVDVKARGPHEVLEEEAKRVINLLAKMIPGEQGGEAVGVKYTLPITLMITGKGKQSNVTPEKIYTNPRPISTVSMYRPSLPIGYVYGQLTDGLNKLPGGNISVEGTDKKTVTDFDGNFKIEANEGDMLVLQFLKRLIKVKVTKDNFYEIAM